MSGGPLAGLFSRFGALSRVEAVGPSSSGAQTLLAAAARSGELALHGVRGLLWILLFLGVASWSGIPAVVAAVLGVVLGGLWLLSFRGLQLPRTFTVTRYALILLDGLFVIRAIASRDGSEIGALAGIFGSTPTPPDVQPYVPALLVLLALSGAARVNIRAAFIVAMIALTAYAYYAIAFRISADEAIFVGAVVLLAGIVGVNAARVLRLMLRRAQEQAVLETFLPEHMSRELTAGGGGLDRVGRLEEVTLLTCDVRGFTKLSEQLTPVETVAFVNSYLEEVCPAIVSSGGVIDKFMGDGVLAFFEGGGHAGRALMAARGIVSAAGRVRTRAGEPIRVGVAIHSGVVLVGTIGPRSRREYTIISDTVNTLSRLEELNKKFESVITASERTLSEVTPQQRAGFLGPETIPVRGRAEPVVVYYHKGPQTQAEAEKAAAAPPPPAPEPEPVAKAEPQITYWKD